MTHKGTVQRCAQTGNGWLVVYKVSGFKGELSVATSRDYAEGENITVVDGVAQ